MNCLSIFSLIRLSSEKINQNELFNRYKIYKQKEALFSSMNNHQQDDKLFINFILNGFDDETQYQYNVDFLDSRENEFSILLLIKQFNDEEVKSSITNDKMINYICYCLKNGKTFSTIYIFMFLLRFLSYKKSNQELIEILKYYSQSVFFSMMSLSFLKDDPEYQILKHNYYYNNITNDIDNNFNFYLNYPDVETPSIYYNLLKLSNQSDCSSKASKYFKPKGKKHNFDKNIFHNLLVSHLCNLNIYENIMQLITDFDNYFYNLSDINEETNYFIKEYRHIFKNQSDFAIISFVLTLFTRCQNIHTFEFALGICNIFSYNKENKNFFHIIEKFTQYDKLLPYCISILSAHPYFQTIVYRIIKKSNSVNKEYLLNYLDYKIKKNYELLKKLSLSNELAFILPSKIMKRIDIISLINKPAITSSDCQFIKKLILESLTNSTYKDICKEINLYEILKIFYEKLIDTKITEAHFESMVILTLLENGYFGEDSKKIQDLMSEKVIYEDEISFIDESISSSKYSSLEISSLMSYYKYCPLNEVIKRFRKKPNKNIALLICIKYFGEEQDINTCLAYLENKFIFNEKFTYLANTDNLDKDQLAEESMELSIISSILIESKEYYPNIYYYGLQYVIPSIRLSFYASLDKLCEQATIDDPKLIALIEDNYSHEKEKAILKLMENILFLNQSIVS